MNPAFPEPQRHQASASRRSTVGSYDSSSVQRSSTDGQPLSWGSYPAQPSSHHGQYQSGYPPGSHAQPFPPGLSSVEHFSSGPPVPDYYHTQTIPSGMPVASGYDPVNQHRASPSFPVPSFDRRTGERYTNHEDYAPLPSLDRANTMPSTMSIPQASTMPTHGLPGFSYEQPPFQIHSSQFGYPPASEHSQYTPDMSTSAAYHTSDGTYYSPTRDASGLPTESHQGYRSTYRDEHLFSTYEDPEMYTNNSSGEDVSEEQAAHDKHTPWYRKSKKVNHSGAGTPRGKGTQPTSGPKTGPEVPKPIPKPKPKPRRY